MPVITQKIMPCLWFDTEGEAAANHYVAIFKNSKVGRIGRYGKEGKEIHGKEAGSVMTVEFELEGQKFLALNGGPQFKFDEAVSFQVFCDTQAEIDYFWSKLAEGGQEGPCGWLKDKFGLSWQVVPSIVPELLRDENSEKAQRVFDGDHADGEARHRGLEKAYAAERTFDDHSLHKPPTSKGECHASPVLPVFQRPLRRGDRVLQEGARRQGRDDDALQARAPGDHQCASGQPRTTSCTPAFASATPP